ncbi:unnamed protein product [Psylliodes chrysocephalus]|uniref:Uncharacterized protein n=1 Tax=Psylliodes chrysocephalus TaxID=3402493 RepID=A0A9P0CHB5_9CUCU|nr:unnamed protein product [Psylliodes chrysocephala]
MGDIPEYLPFRLVGISEKELFEDLYVDDEDITDISDAENIPSDTESLVEETYDPENEENPNYVNKGSDMVVFRIENTNVNAPPLNQNDEITNYQIGRYISSNEAVWRIFVFPIHERDPAFIHLAVHLENGQRVYFTNDTALDRAINPPKITLTEFFELCNRPSQVNIQDEIESVLTSTAANEDFLKMPGPSGINIQDVALTSMSVPHPKLSPSVGSQTPKFLSASSPRKMNLR